MEPCIYRPDLFLTCSGTPAWKRLITRPLTLNERIALITDLFSDCDETEVIKQLSGDDAQSFVDVIDQVSSKSFQVEPLCHVK